jgi:DNA-binding FadR family transcriptional regulator
MTATEDTLDTAAVVEAAITAPAGGAAAIATQLRREILDGRYAFRERLPAERDLAVIHRASRSTVREALRQLEESHLVTRRVGSGTFIAYRGPTTADHDIADVTSPLELIEVRRAIEPEMAALAVIHGTGRNLERLKDALDKVERARDSESFTRADAHFHLMLAECSQNPLMVWLYERINDVRSHAQWSLMKDKVLTAKAIAAYNAQHRALVAAIVRRDREAARAVIGEHLEKARRDLVGAGA